jgi:hypothetical protein
MPYAIHEAIEKENVIATYLLALVQRLHIRAPWAVGTQCPQRECQTLGTRIPQG